MGLRFKPMPGLTLAVLICLPILIGLGVWQYQRWQWKQGVLTEIDAAVNAPPLRGLAAFEALSTESAVNFRRIQFDGSIPRDAPVRHLYRPSGNLQWVPFRRVEDADHAALVAFPAITDAIKDTAPVPDMGGVRAGYVRRIDPRRGFEKWVGPANNPIDNRWFEIDPAWLGDGQTTSYYIDASDGFRDAAALPVRRPDIPNNHVSYMFTWWSFAVILLVIYALLHRRAGRLSWS